MNSQGSDAISTSTEANTLRGKASVVVFFLVAFGVPWTTMLIVIARHIAFSELSAPFMLSAAFCSVGGVVATYVDSGRSGLKALARRCLLYQVPVAWWLYALFTPLGVHVLATLIYDILHGAVGAITPMELFHQWWQLYIFAFALFQGPLSEELGWRGYLLPRILRKYSPINASIMVGVVWAAWHFAILFHSVSADALFFASAVALSILMTVLFLHTRGSVLLAIVMHWSGTPGKEIARVCLSAHEPPDWVRAVVLITIAAIVVALTGRKLGLYRLQSRNY
jgi:membrane protease YdiL (CAAX protease family)